MGMVALHIMHVMFCQHSPMQGHIFFNRGTGIACDSTNLEVKRVACNARAETFTEVYCLSCLNGSYALESLPIQPSPPLPTI